MESHAWLTGLLPSEFIQNLYKLVKYISLEFRFSWKCCFLLFYIGLYVRWKAISQPSELYLLREKRIFGLLFLFFSFRILLYLYFIQLCVSSLFINYLLIIILRDLLFYIYFILYIILEQNLYLFEFSFQDTVYLPIILQFNAVRRVTLSPSTIGFYEIHFLMFIYYINSKRYWDSNFHSEGLYLITGALLFISSFIILFI